MLIRALQNLSLVDYPAHLAAVIFVEGCNFYCPYCQNPDLLKPAAGPALSEEEILSSLSRRKDKIEAVVVTGGEPSLYKDLPNFAARVKDLGLKFKLDTNASNPDQLEAMLRLRLLDHIAVDIKTSLDKYHLVTDIKEIAKLVTRSIYLVKLATVPYEFRTTCAPGIVGEDDFYAIGELVQGAEKYCLQQFRPIITYDKSYQTKKPCPKESLEKFKKILESFVKKVEIRGI